MRRYEHIKGMQYERSSNQEGNERKKKSWMKRAKGTRQEECYKWKTFEIEINEERK